MSRRLTVAVLILGLCSLSGAPLPDAWLDSPSAALEAAASAEASLAPDPEVATAAAFLTRRPTGLTESEIGAVAAAIVAESRRAGLSPRFTLAVIHVESGGHNFAVSEAGALGLMQLLPSTAEGVAEEIGLHWRGPRMLFEPVTNVRLGVHYLAGLMRRFGDVPTALAAYNWGPTRIAEYITRGDPIPARYAERVLGAYRTSETAARHT